MTVHPQPTVTGRLVELDVRRSLRAMTFSDRLAVAITFILTACGSLVLTLYVGLQNSPKATLYTSGISLFPSPLGTAIGTAFGVTGLALVDALVIGAVSASVIALRVPLRSIAVALPVLIWAAPLGVNVIAGAFFALGWMQRRERWYWVAAGFHLSVLLLLIAVSRVRWVAAAALGIGLTLLLVTPYGAGMRSGEELERIPQALAGGLVVATLGLLPGLVAGVRVWRRPFLELGIALAVGTAYAVRYDLSDGYVLWTSIPQTVRYAFPVVLVCFVEASRAKFSTGNQRDGAEPTELTRGPVA